MKEKLLTFLYRLLTGKIFSNIEDVNESEE